jgi:hypothetical protein
MEDVERVFLFDFWRSAEAFSGEDPQVLAQVQQMFKTRVFLEFGGRLRVVPRTEALGFRVLGNVLLHVPTGTAQALRRFFQGYMRREAQGQQQQEYIVLSPQSPRDDDVVPFRRRSPSRELPVEDGSNWREEQDDDEDDSSSSRLQSPPPPPSHEELYDFPVYSQSIPFALDDDDERGGAFSEGRSQAERDALEFRVYEQLEREREQEREEHRRRLRQQQRERLQNPPPPPPPTSRPAAAVVNGDAFASIAAFQTNVWRQDSNLMGNLATQNDVRMGFLPHSPFMDQTLQVARETYYKRR